MLAASLIATPFTIRLLGPERYGLLALLNLVIAYLCYTDFGMNAASTKLSAERHSANDDSGEASTVWTAFTSSAASGIGFALATIFLAPQLASALRLTDALAAEAVPAIRIAALVFLGRSLSSVMNSPQLVRLRMKSATLINSSVGVAQVVCAPLVLWLGGTLVHVMWCVAGITALGLLAHCFVSAGLLKELSSASFDSKLLRSLWTFGLGVTMALVADLVLTNFERIILTAFGSLTVLAYYSVAYTLASLVIMVPTALGHTIFPAFSRISSKDELARMYSRAFTGTLVVVTPIAILVALTARPVLTAWAGADYGRASYLPCLILLAGIWLQSISYVSYNLLMAGDEGNRVARLRWVQVLPFLIFAVWCVTSYGAVGAAAAWSIRVAVDLVAMLFLAKRRAGTRLVPFDLSSIRGISWRRA